MTSPNELRPDDNKVVELTGRGDPRTERVGELLGAVRALTLKRSHDLASTLLDNVDDALFDLAEKAESNAAQTQFFDGMREVRKRRPLLERLLGEQVARNFNDFASGQPRVSRSGTNASTRTGELSLVDDRELEESLAIASMVSKAESRLNSPLHALNQRLGVICGGHHIEDASNPLGPASLAHAFRTALREIDVDIKVRLIVLKLFERYVLSGLDALYHEVNVQLMQAGVLPHLKHVIARTPSSGAAEPARQAEDANAAAATSSSHAAGSVASESAGLHAELMHTLTALLAARRQPRHHDMSASGGVAAGGPTIASLTPAELLGALTLLQGETAPLPTQPVVVDQDAAVGMVQRLKDELMAQIQRLSGENRAHVSGADEDTIDLVGMLFEYILQDRTIPAPMQVLLSRLQIPYLKVAILDKHLFAQKTHPARRLLDALADAGKSWSEESDKDHRLQDRIRQVVESILTDFDDDVGIFERELENFAGFMEQYHRRAEIAEQRAAEATRGREKLQDARRTAAREILSRIEERNLPPVVHAVLSRPWANYLVLTLLRQGENSDEWKSALRFADEFVWSALPKTNDLERTRLRALLPQLEKALRHGLATVAYHDNDVKQLMHELSQFYQRLLDGEKVEVKTAKEVIAAGAASAIPGAVPVQPVPAAAGAPQAEAPAPPVVPATQSPVEEIVLNSNPAETPAPEENYAEDDEFLKAAREIKVGTWLEFADEQGNRERAKLSWISPISSKYLFVNRRGLKVCDKTVFALAAELRRGSTIVLEEVPLFDRALDAIVARLRSAQSDAAPAKTAAAAT